MINKNTGSQTLAKKPINYINNRALYEELKLYKKRVKEAEEAGLEKPRIPDSIGSAIIMLAEKLASKHNWRGYSYRDEMVFDAIENCIMYAVAAFDPDKSENPFGYFSLTIKNAFIRRLKKEQTQQLIKDKLAIKTDVDRDVFDSGSGNLAKIRKGSANGEVDPTLVNSARMRVKKAEELKDAPKDVGKRGAPKKVVPVEWTDGERERLVAEFLAKKGG